MAGLVRLGGSSRDEPFLIPKLTERDRMEVKGLPHSDPAGLRIAGLTVTLQPFILAIQTFGQFRDDRPTVFVSQDTERPQLFYL